MISFQSMGFSMRIPSIRTHRKGQKGPDASAARDGLKALTRDVKDSSTRKALKKELQSFQKLLGRYQDETAKTREPELVWDHISCPSTNKIIQLDQLQPVENCRHLKKLAVLKMNGGLGTSMGLTCSKGALEVKENMTFLDMIVTQINHLNATHQVNVPLLLMTSFNTCSDTPRIIEKYAKRKTRIAVFNQSRYPLLMKETFQLYPKSASKCDEKAWYPPGHGDLYNSLMQSGVLDRLLRDGKEYLFVSESDNLGAVVDTRILQHMVDSKADFLMEVAGKTKQDVENGTLVDYDGSLRLLELGQVPPDHVEDFKSVRNFSVFNTNNLWINLKALKRVMQRDAMTLDIIVKQRTSDDGNDVIQLETAAGAAIRHFKNAQGVQGPRSRYMPVKTCADLLLIKSDLYSFKHGQPVLNERRMFHSVPVIKLGDRFKKIEDFQQRIRHPLNMVELDHLTITGDVRFGKNVTLRGTVIILAKDGESVDVPDDCILENTLMSGSLRVIEL